MIAIIGAGITGLALGHALKEQGMPFRIFDAGQTPGGNIQSLQEDGFLLELGPNSLMMNDRIYALLATLGLTNHIERALPSAKYRYVLRNGKYRRLPSGPVSFLTSGMFSLKEKVRALRERGVRPAANEGETVDAFFRRRFGDAIADYALAPFVSGIYAGDPKNLDMAAAFPRIKAMELTHGAVLKGFGKGPKNTHKGIFSLTGGLSTLTNALATQISEELTLGTRVSGIQQQEKGFLLDFEGGVEPSLAVEKVVVTIPAYALAEILPTQMGQLSPLLKSVYMPPVSLLHTAWHADAFAHKLDGFGALHNQIEDTETLGTIFSSSVFAGRNPAGTILLTTFVGGARTPEKALRPESEILTAASADFTRFLGLKPGAKPVMSRVTTYEKAIPQYRNGVQQLWEKALSYEASGMFFGGNWIGGISVPNCLDRAWEICAKVTS